MRIREIKEILGADVLCGADALDTEVSTVFGADMMSDVLAYVDEHTLLLTGMVNAHVIRTAEMLDVKCIVFVRGKQVTDEVLQMAIDRDIIVLVTEKTLYVTSGLLYQAGLPGCTRSVGL